MGEFELINQYFKRDTSGSSVVLGVGDDCSLLQLPAEKQLAISVDTLLADVHFPADGDPEAIAERALCVSLSDLAAMGAKPLWFTLALTLPEANEAWVSAFSRGLFRAANTYGCELVGGDTTRGPLSISVQVMGSVEPHLAMKRSGAAVGDLLFVSGTLGDGAAALAVLNGSIKVDDESSQYLSGRYYHPEPRLALAQTLAPLASAAIDVSDGLVADLGHICKASSVAATVFVERLPLSSAILKCAATPQQYQWALSGGDDYQLCFTVAPANIAQVEQLIAAGLDATNIGEITEGKGVHCRLIDHPFEIEGTGYNHFD
ncbi:thiamine-phosphate kinase [Alteromonadaceae bacterium Bs31]|nr:thiamine-phosphate kinase [Alteromonadaceae bacterium Bs31]